MNTPHRPLTARHTLPNLPRHRLWRASPPSAAWLRLWRGEVLGALAVLAVAAVFVSVMLASVAQAQRRQAGLQATQQQRMACEQLGKPSERRACAAAATATPARLAAAL